MKGTDVCAEKDGLPPFRKPQQVHGLGDACARNPLHLADQVRALPVPSLGLRNRCIFGNIAK
jgi:hypothetical protein